MVRWEVTMMPAIHTALSGLSAVGKAIGVTAHNLANANTDRFKKSRTQFQEALGGGVQATVHQDNSPGPEVLRDSSQGPTIVELSNVDLGGELVDLMIAQRAFQANLKVLGTADQTLGSILDIRK
jgi:flagellar basal-body rod protein FlgC